MSDTQPQGDEQPTTPPADDNQPTTSPATADSGDQERVLTDGRFAVAESDDNAIATSDDDFIGIAPEYQEYADDRFAPLPADGGPEEDLEQRAKDNQAELDKQATTGNNRTGYSPSAPHPSDARQPSADLIDKQRQSLDKMAGR